VPDLEQSKSAVLNSLTWESSQRSYDHAIRELIDWYCSEPRLAFNKTVVTRYRIFLEQAHYASATINLRLAAVRRLAYEAADAGLLGPDLAAGIRRVKGAKKLGVRIGNWLTAEQGKRLLAAVDRRTLCGVRDYAMIGVLLGCRLRRAEPAAPCAIGLVVRSPAAPHYRNAIDYFLRPTTAGLCSFPFRGLCGFCAANPCRTDA
jgi:site-specific recombinase XerC